MPDHRNRLDGGDLRDMFSAAARLFERNVESINALNVFPVPDGDTGTNMYLTLREVVREAEGVQTDSAGDVLSAMARGALREARGNSGVILCQFFKGMELGLDGSDTFGSSELASALLCAREHAYKAVGKPVEGTLLTVISSVAEVAERGASSGDDIQQMFDLMSRAARDSVALTPTMLPVLREAGVVDAGGQGLAVILEGMRRHVNGEDIKEEEITPPEPVGVETARGTVSSGFLEATDELQYGYCTQFLVEGRDLDTGLIRGKMASMADSAVVVGDETMVKVHVHASDPGPVISAAVSLGTLAQVKVENMDRQHREYSEARRQEAGPRSEGPEAASVSVVAVASGRGLEEVFKGLGAANVLTAGDTMNPSIQQIVEITEAASGDDVIFLPNNRNIVPAAQKATEIARGLVRVVPSTSIPQGIAAILAFNSEQDLERNAAEMERAMESVRSGEVCRAIRSVQLDGVSVKDGQLIGLLERRLAVAGDDPTEVLLALLRAADLANGDLVTLYWGSPMTEGEAKETLRRAEAAFPNVEVELVAGGQPHYHFIVSID